jgi:hypothetical protein
MSDVVYTSRVRIERIKGPLRRAYLPVEPAPALFGVHSEMEQLEKGKIDDHSRIAPHYPDLCRCAANN